MKEDIPALDISHFGIDPESGFLKWRFVPISLVDIAQKYAPWELLAQNLPVYYTNRTLAAEIEKLPPFLEDVLEGEYQQRAFQILTFINQALAHPYRSQEVGSGQTIPAKTAIPVCKLALQLGRLPIMSYDEYCLKNCVLQNVPPFRSCIEVKDLCIYQKFVFTPDEEGFITPHQAMEWKGAPILVNVGTAQKSVLVDDRLHLKSSLWKMAAAEMNMISQQLLMWEHCSPEKYPTEVRPQIQKFDSVIFEGVSRPPFDKPVSLRGETGAQSPLFRVMDTFLGIKHEKTELTDHLTDIENYMSPQHRNFIRAVETGPSVREYVLRAGETDGELNDGYNSMVQALVRLRENHFAFMKYIPKTGDSQLGTGGTPIYQFLPQFIRETKEHLIGQRRQNDYCQIDC